MYLLATLFVIRQRYGHVNMFMYTIFAADALRLENIVSVIFASTPGSESKDMALTKFLSGSADVLMLCSRTTSSGINLQARPRSTRVSSL